ncbi:MAG: HGGxSTG domain-containing protein [Limnohabitans sp.]
MGGRIQCPQCQATSKRTGQQCKAPALKGKHVCRFHGGMSTGPKTPEGRQRCSKAKTVHGRETASLRNERSLASARLATLEAIGRTLKMIPGFQTVGRKPNRAALACPELCHLLEFLNKSDD